MADDKTAGLRRRFYTTVSVAKGTGSFQVLLDERPVKTPGKVPLAIAKPALADAVAAEWRAQGEKIDPHSMPLTQIACTAIDRLPVDRSDIVDLLTKYAETDLICYRAAAPQDLVVLQSKTWQPVLDWLAEALGICLNATTAILPMSQDQAALDAVRAAVTPLDDHELAAVSVLIQATGSVGLGLAVAGGRLDVDGAVEASQLDERYQSALWGIDREAEQRLRNIHADIDAAARYLALHRS